MRGGELDAALSGTHNLNGYMVSLELAQERELESVLRHYPCPDILWQGLFALIGDRLKKRSWEVWLGVLCGLGAVAHKNIHCQYHRPLFGMVYGLLISPTGTGKGLCTDVCRALLPEWYTVRRTVSSGAGLFPILATITKDSKGRIVHIAPRPAILVVEEWTNLLKAAKIEFSNLQELLNELFHSPFPFSVSRSDSEKSGGDRVVDNPILSICATTTASLLKDQVTSKLIRGGFLNRYFIVPGSGDPWDYYDADAAAMNCAVIRGYTDHLTGHTLGFTRSVWELYTPDARERLITWGRLFFNPLMAAQSLEAEALKRLHVYSHIIGLLYAWSEQCPAILPRHVEAAITAVSVSRLFVEGLMSDTDVEIPKIKQYEMGLEGKILAKIEKEPGISVRKIGQDLRKSGTYHDIAATTHRLAKEGQIRCEKNGRAETFFPASVVPSVAL